MTLRWTNSVDDLGPNRVLVYSDLHLGNHAACSRVGPGGVNTRLLWGVEVVRQMRKLAEEYAVLTVWCLGDVVETGKTRLPTAVADTGFPALRELHAAVPGVLPKDAQDSLVLVGNHDGPHAEKTALRPMEGWPGVRLVTAPVRLTLGGRNVLAIPYIRDVEQLRDVVVEHQRPGDLVLMHAGIRGAAVGPERDHFIGDGELPAKTFTDDAGRWIPDAVLTGHYHAHQVLHDGRVVYCGAPMQHTFGERFETGSCLLLDVDSLRFVRFALHSPVFRTEEIPDVKTAKRLAKEIRKAGVPTYLRAVIPEGSKVSLAKLRAAVSEDLAAPLVVVDRRGAVSKETRAPVLSSGMNDEEMVRAYVGQRPPGWSEDPAEIERLVAQATAYIGEKGAGA